MVKVNRNHPIDIESNILSRLPVKTLLRFKSVQKSWYSLLSDPYFINLHLRRPKNKDDNLVLMQHYDGNCDIKVVNTCSNVLSNFDNPSCKYTCSVVGSSNGLVCVYGFNEDTFFHNNNNYVTEYIGLWNPALRINKIICHKRRVFSYNKTNDACVGFGFHNKTNDYKVIRFTNEVRTRSRLKEVEIYSLSSDSWRNIEVADSWENIEVADSWGPSFGLKMGVYVSDATLIPNFSGAYCWLAGTFENGKLVKGIISFDIGDEVFKDMMLPPVDSPTYLKLRLFSYKDSLALVEMKENISLSLCHIWVMKEYNDPSSWTKLCKVDAHCPRRGALFVGITLETELVMLAEIRQKSGSYKDKVFVFAIDNSQTNTSCITKDIRILGKAKYVSSFTESLVLL